MRRGIAVLAGVALVACAVAPGCGRSPLDADLAGPLSVAAEAGPFAGEGGDGSRSCGAIESQAADGACVPCSPSTCAGCCTAGRCFPGDTHDACGVSGGFCFACPANRSCIAGTCTAGEVVLFGGQSGQGQPLGDTWAFDGVGWTQVTGPSPSARRGHAMATLEGTVVLFGGADLEAPLGDTWTFDGARWKASPATGPAARSGHGMTGVFDRVAMFGGRGASTGTGGGALLGDLWAFDGTAWTPQPQAPAPSARTGAAMAMQIESDEANAIVFGGASASGALGDLWVLWSSTGGTWETSTATGPSPRSGHALATMGGDIVLFGGQDATGAVLGDTWTFNSRNWTVQVTSGGPTPRYGHAMAALRGQVVLFGGQDATGAALDDTWTYDGATWTQVPVSGPPPRAGHAMAALP